MLWGTCNLMKSLKPQELTSFVLHRLAPNCGPLFPPPNGNVATPSGTTSGNVALYSCDEGLVLTGSTARVCGNDGLWTPTTPICEGQCTNWRLQWIYFRNREHCLERFLYCAVIDFLFALLSTVPTCGQLSGPVNGALSLSSGVSEGSVATYTCNPGFTLTGSVTRTCTSEGGWTPAAPVCLRISKS